MLKTLNSVQFYWIGGITSRYAQLWKFQIFFLLNKILKKFNVKIVICESFELISLVVNTCELITIFQFSFNFLELLSFIWIKSD